MAKLRRRDGDDVATMTAGDVSTMIGTSLESLDDAIARRAFELYCARGCEDGHDVEDWLFAEREMRGL